MIERVLFDYLPNGDAVYAYKMKGKSPLCATILNYGGIIQSLTYPSSKGRITDVVGGFDNISDYLASGEYQGAIIGRVANRIKDGLFSIDDCEYTVPKNEPNCTCHGGLSGFNAKIWDVTPGGSENEPELTLNYTSRDGEEGFPGNLDICVTYTLTEHDSLKIVYSGVTDKKTIINLTNHSYFNLSGVDAETVDDHIISVMSTHINETDSELIPTGRILNIADTDFDLRRRIRLGDVLNANDPKIRELGGLDTNYIFDCYDGSVACRAELISETSGIGLKVYTDNTSMQIYTANSISPSEPRMKRGSRQTPHFGICLETGSMPDAINHENFDNIQLNVGDHYARTTEFEFRNI